jgi:hypothetical protein
MINTTVPPLGSAVGGTVVGSATTGGYVAASVTTGAGVVSVPQAESSIPNTINKLIKRIFIVFSSLCIFLNGFCMFNE